MILQSHSWVYIRRKTLSKRTRVLYPNVIAALFTTAKTWQQLNCLTTEKRIEKLQYIGTRK